MAQAVEMVKTIWTSTFCDREGTPAAVANEQLSREQLEEILKSTPARDKVEPYESRLDENILSATFA